MSARLNKVSEIFALVAASMVVAVSLAELFLRVVVPVEDPYAPRKALDDYIRSSFAPHLRLITQAEDGLPGVSGRNTFTINNLGFRGDSLIIPKPAREFRVFLVGGSTTECLFLDDADALDAVVQRELQREAVSGTSVRVYGAGKSGDRSDDHVSMMVHRIVQLEPDVVVVFAGFNDLLAALGGYDYLRHANVTRLLNDSLTLWPLLRLTATETQLGRRLFYLLKGFPGPRLGTWSGERPLTSGYRSAVERLRAAPRADSLPEWDVAPYGDNLRTIIGAARAHGVQVVLMTQQATWNATVDQNVEQWQWMRSANGITLPADQMDAALDSVNETTRRVGRDLGVPIYDLARSIPKSLEFFYDDAHFNVRGANRAGRELAALIQRLVVQSR